MCFGCGEGDNDEARDQQKQMAVATSNLSGARCRSRGSIVYERTRKMTLQEKLNVAQRKGVKLFRHFAEFAANTPGVPRMEYIYQQFCSAIRAVGLALEEQPRKDQASFPVVLAFFQCQVDRFQDAIDLLDNAYNLYSQEQYQQMNRGDTVADAIMRYAAILPGMKQILQDAMKDQMRSRDAVQADIDRVNRGERPLGPQRNK